MDDPLFPRSLRAANNHDNDDNGGNYWHIVRLIMAMVDVALQIQPPLYVPDSDYLSQPLEYQEWLFCVEISGMMLILTTFVLREGMFHFFAGCGFKAEREAANPSSWWGKAVLVLPSWSFWRKIDQRVYCPVYKELLHYTIDITFETLWKLDILYYLF